MGLVHSKVTVSNPSRPDLQSIVIDVLVDTGATNLCIPRHIQIQLGLQETDYREVRLADGSIQKVPYVGPIEVRFANRVAYVGALVLGDEALLGAIPMEDMDLVVLPKTQTLAVNPESPNMAMASAK